MTLPELKAFFLVDGAQYMKMYSHEGRWRQQPCTLEVLALIAEADRLVDDLVRLDAALFRACQEIVDLQLRLNKEQGRPVNVLDAPHKL
jgi:hypothetical protein